MSVRDSGSRNSSREISVTPYRSRSTTAARSSDPTYLTQSDIDASAVPGLRTPRSVAASVTLAVRRTTPLKHGTLAPILNNLALQSSFTAAGARSEFENGHAHDLRVGVEYNLLRAVAPTLASALPTELVLTSTFEHGDDQRLTFLKPAATVTDFPRVVSGLTNSIRNGGALAFHPVRNGLIRFNMTSLRDLRAYGADSSLGIIDAAERDRIAGLDAGLERERDVGTQVSYNVQPATWLRARMNTSSNYNMLRDPNTLSFVRAVDSAGPLRIPRKIGNTVNTNLGVTIDVPALVRASPTLLAPLRALLSAFQPIDVSLDRNVLSAYDASPATPPLMYQLGFGDIGFFRHLAGEDATSAGVNTQFGISQSIQLPYGATLTNHFQRVTLRNWTRGVSTTDDVGDATQVIFPDVALRWSRRITAPRSPLASFNASARVVGTRQLLSSPGEFDLPDGDNGETRIRTYPVTPQRRLGGRTSVHHHLRRERRTTCGRPARLERPRQCARCERRRREGLRSPRDLAPAQRPSHAHHTPEQQQRELRSQPARDDLLGHQRHGLPQQAHRQRPPFRSPSTPTPTSPTT